MKVAVVGDESTVTGYKLAGIGRSQIISSEKEAKKVINELEGEFEIIIVTDKYLPDIDPTESESLVIGVPGRGGPSGKEGLEDVVKSAIGVEVE